MACIEFDDLLVGYDDLTPEQCRALDAHIAACETCRARMETLTALDQELAAAWQGVAPSPAFRDAVLRRVRAEARVTRPSYVPELLDFIGYTAVAAIIAALLYQWGLPPQFRPYAPWAFGAALLATGLWSGWRSRADLAP